MRFNAIASAAVFANIATATLQEQIPEQCKPTFDLAEREGNHFYHHLMSNVCDRGCAVPAHKLLPELDNVVTEYLEFIWTAVNPPLDLHNDVLPTYQELKNECVLDPEWGVAGIQNVCDVDTGDEKLNQMVQQCIVPKVEAKYLFRMDELSDWAKNNCQKAEPAIQKLLVQTRQVRNQCGLLSMSVIACPGSLLTISYRARPPRVPPTPTSSLTSPPRTSSAVCIPRISFDFRIWANSFTEK